MKDRATGIARARSAVVAVGVALLLVACSRSENKSESARDAALATGATAAPRVADVDGRALVQGACLSCHTEQMLAQQRLTKAQWQKTVTKMVGWGANLEPSEVGPLVDYLSAAYGADAGGYVPETVTAADALAEISPLPDPFPAGDAERGKPLYIEKCSGCHGQDARGHIGVALVDRPFLYRAADVAKTIRKGRGKMLPIALPDADIADVLAHLRSLKNPPPP